MNVFGCDSCFNDQRSMNDKFQQAIIDAQKFSNEQQKKVAVFQENEGFRHEAFNGAAPPGCCKVVVPV